MATAIPPSTPSLPQQSNFRQERAGTTATASRADSRDVEPTTATTQQRGPDTGPTATTGQRQFVQAAGNTQSTSTSRPQTELAPPPARNTEQSEARDRVNEGIQRQRLEQAIRPPAAGPSIEISV